MRALELLAKDLKKSSSRIPNRTEELIESFCFEAKVLLAL
jgi:hypothetical protein